MRTTWTFHSAGSIVFGPGAAAHLSEIAARDGLRRVFVATDEPIVRAGLVEQIQRPLQSANVAVEIFAGGEPEPSLKTAEHALAAAKAFRPDAILGLGGGSNIDLAKVVATVLTHGGVPRDYFGDDQLRGPIMPVICVPTTAGTGSEVSGSAVLTDQENQIKVGLLSNFMRPRWAVVDPCLTLTCPKKVTADSGIDALTHAIEAFTAVDNEVFPLPPGEKTIYQGRHLLGDALAEKAIALVGQHLVRAVHEPANLEARSGMSLAALLAGLAFSNVGVALTHALEYPLGGLVHCSHGEGNGLLLPYVMRYNLPVREARFAEIARLLGRNIDGLSVREAAEQAIIAVEDLRREIGIPLRLRELGVPQDQLPKLAEKAAGIKRILRVNPRYPTVTEMTEIFQSAW